MRSLQNQPRLASMVREIALGWERLDKDIQKNVTDLLKILPNLRTRFVRLRIGNVFVRIFLMPIL